MKKVTPEKIIELGQKLCGLMESCVLCPMECRVNRFKGELGKCNSGVELKIASHNIHFGEEPPLSGGGGSGTIFLSNCSLFCKYCQNYPISQMGNGRIVSIDELKDMMLDLQKRGAENINFVTPDHMIALILMALGKAKQEGLKIPIVYNCSGYQKLDILRQLEGIIDIYLPDMRYNEDGPAVEYSGCRDYLNINRTAIKEMFRQVGLLKLNRKKMAKSGMIVRHLVLPGGLSGSAGIFQFLAGEISKDIHVSLMSQYFPAYQATEDKTISRRITTQEFSSAVDSFYAAGLRNGYIQELDYEEI
jgi:putative pyruvate formate lyase activating enzyme